MSDDTFLQDLNDPQKWLGWEFAVVWVVPTTIAPMGCAVIDCDAEPCASWVEQWSNEDGTDERASLTGLCVTHAHFAAEALDDICEMIYEKGSDQ